MEHLPARTSLAPLNEPGPDPEAELDPRVAALVEALIGRVADKWTLILIEVLTQHPGLRFGHIAQHVPGISQKMLAQTLRHMERDGLVERTVFAVVPPRVEYTLTALGATLSAAFCGVWIWAQQNLQQVDAARRRFDQQAAGGAAPQAGRTIVKAGKRLA